GGHQKALVHNKTVYFPEADATRLRYMTEQISSQRLTPQGSEADTTRLRYMTEQIISQRRTPQGSVRAGASYTTTAPLVTASSTTAMVADSSSKKRIENW
ncbi:hypothetical protein RRG08_046366, partial [Elysia crispata]